MSISKAVWRLAALGCAGGFFWLATRVDVYAATSPSALSHTLFGSYAPDLPHPWFLSLHIWLRKFYSIVAFAIVGLTADKALAPTARPRLRAAILVALYSAGIEVMQGLVDPYEPWYERFLDIACGAGGGWLGVSLANRLERRPIVSTTRHSSANPDTLSP